MRGKRILQIVLAVLAVLILVVAVFAYVLPRRSFPQTEGTLRIPGLKAPVTIYRDAYGIPHIYASNVHDLFFAQGYVHAQDRFWQMDTWRHIGMGRLAEMFGASQVETDKFLRTLGWERQARQEYENMSPEDRAILDAYAEGVNAYLRDHQGAALSLEYAVLKLLNPNYKPEPWTPVHSLVWAKVMAWDLGGNMKLEIEKAVLLATLPPERVAEVIPSYPFDRHPVIVPEYGTATSAPQAVPPQVDYAALAPLFRDLAARAAQVEAVLGPITEGLGSNSWVIGGSRTSTGKPFLANDPHLAAQLPSIWYEVGLHCEPKTADCPFEVTGFSFAGVPGVIIGHNDRIAWGFTNVGPDVQDLYILKIHPENPNQYEFNGQWVDMDVYTETIQVAGGEPMELTVRWTRFGPIISEVYKPLQDLDQKTNLDLPAHYAVALRWTALRPTTTYAAILGFNRAQNWEEFRQAAALFEVPAQNLVYADVDGNIGYQMPGTIPIRNPHHDGTLPVPGWTDEYDWQGFIPFEELPHVFNPPKGYIVTANNAVVGPEYPYRISPYWDLGYRAWRIVDLIESAPGPIDADYIAQMHMDSYNAIAAHLVPMLQNVDMGDARLNDLRNFLADWDFQMRMDSPQAALFAAFWKHLLADTFHDEMPEDYLPKGNSRWLEVIYRLSQDPTNAWWDDTTTPEKEDRDAMFRRAFQKAVAELESAQGNDPTKWSWGKMHALYLTHQTLGKSGVALIEQLFNRGPYATSGDASTVNNTTWDPLKGYMVDVVPSMRMIVDLSDLSRSQSIHLTGQSGHAYHPHYVDMVDLWRTGKYHPMLWTKEQVEQAAEAVLRLVP